MILPTNFDRERLGWLECLIDCHDAEHDWENDEDPSATREMLAMCKSLLRELAEANPEPPQEPTPAPLDANGNPITF